MTTSKSSTSNKMQSLSTYYSSSSTTTATETTQLLPPPPQEEEESQQLYDDDRNDNIMNNNSKNQLLSNARFLLYVSHFFNQFSEGAWQFCLVLFLAAFSNYESLVLVCSYGLVSGTFVCWFGSTAGRFIDGYNRLFVAQTFIGIENLCVLLATLCCYILLLQQQQQQEDDIDFDHNSTTSLNEEHRLNNGIPTDPISILLLVGIHLLGPAARIMDSGFVVAVERDWIVVMSKYYSMSTATTLEAAEGRLVVEGGGDTSSINNQQQDQQDEGQQILEQQKKWLSETNVTMKQIDLSCKIVAPAFAGFFVALFDDGSGQSHGLDLSGAAFLVGLLNVMALIVEYICTHKIYHQIPLLQNKVSTATATTTEETEPTTTTTTTTTTTSADIMSTIEDIIIPEHPTIAANTTTSTADTDTALVKIPNNGVHYNNNNKNSKTEKRRCIFRLPNGLSVYFQQPISWAGAALALLYLNVLTFGGIMTAYLVWKGMRLDTIGVWRGISSAVGLLGTFVYQFMSNRNMGQVDTGMWSVVYQFFCLSLSYASLFVTDFDTSTAMLIVGVCASRVGLWVFDISVTQLMQEHIPEDVRGLVGGVQEALNAFFGLLSFALGLFLSDPRDFHYYVSVGYAAVGLAVICFAVGVFPKRKQFQTD